MNVAARLLTKSTVVTIIAVAAATVIFALDRWITQDHPSQQDWLETLLIPVVVGFPIALYIFAQSERLHDAYQQLATLNAATERAHRQLQEAHEMIACAARHDKMTGLVNREYFLEVLEQAYRQAEDKVLLIVDVDRFKDINDRFGHLEGDKALIQVAATLQRAVRPHDIIGRLGGDEFGVLLQMVPVSTAADIAEGMRLAVEQLEWRPGDTSGSRLSISIGGVALADVRDSVTTAIAHADACLYQAKRSGRNSIAFNQVLADLARAMAAYQNPGSRVRGV